MRIARKFHVDILKVEAEKCTLDYQGCRVIFRQKGNNK